MLFNRELLNALVTEVHVSYSWKGTLKHYTTVRLAWHPALVGSRKQFKMQRGCFLPLCWNLWRERITSTKHNIYVPSGGGGRLATSVDCPNWRDVSIITTFLILYWKNWCLGIPNHMTLVYWRWTGLFWILYLFCKIILYTLYMVQSHSEGHAPIPL